MDFNDFADNAETLEPVVVSAGTRDYSTTYGKLIMAKDSEDTQHVTYLTDYLRMLRITKHWNGAGYDLCNTMYKRPCSKCEPSKEQRAKGDKPEAPTISRVGLMWHHEHVGETRTSDRGTEYSPDVIEVIDTGSGTSGINHKTLREANCEHPDFPEPEDFYNSDGKTRTVNQETLINCRLMYDDRGEDKIWQIRKLIKIDPKTGKAGRPSYPEPKDINKDKARKNLGKEATLRVPKEVRDFFDKQELKDLAPFYLVHFGNVDWKALGLEPPKEGQKFIVESKEAVAAGNKKKVDANEAL